jgi:pyruvate dehydrogenase E2 component (dihydrolipoamide acetyltransferase)
VPVIRNVDHKSVRQISDEILDLSERARTGSLNSEQAGKSTFTISNLGIAVARDDGLIVPVIRNADHKSVRQISDEILDLSERARTGSLKSEQAGKSTFTISNLGMYGIEQFTAIINPPESAILAVGCVKQKFVPSVNGAPEVRPMMKMTLSCDHRVIDGAIGADFLKDLKDLIENPALMLA